MAMPLDAKLIGQGGFCRTITHVYRLPVTSASRPDMTLLFLRNACVAAGFPNRANLAAHIRAGADDAGNALHLTSVTSAGVYELYKLGKRYVRDLLVSCYGRIGVRCRDSNQR